MGDPFSLAELAEAGPSNYWKVLQVATVPGSQSDHMNKNKSIYSNAAEVPNALNQHKGPDKGMHLTGHVVSPIQREVSRNMLADNVTVEGNLIDSVKHGESTSTFHKDKKVPDSAKSAGVVSDPDMESRSNSFTITSIKEGSLVEVLKDRGDLNKAWFCANVLSLKDREALVCYRELQSDEGSEKLKEWISVEPEDGNAPKIRIPHPMTAGQFEGTRKRRRAAVKDYSWSVGDKVDAYLDDSWWEGIITEKNDKDPTTLSVHFPAKGETSLVKGWHLRPTLIWSDGQWVEWCRPGEDGTSQGDTPVEKRAKLGSTNIEIKGKGKMGKTIDFVETRRNEETRLPLAANEKVFNIGSTKEEKKPNTVKTMRPDRKEGSRVVFGVPKPGKKRKFMEVSKHYVSDRNPKINAPNDSAKLAKFLPQGSGARGFKSNTKVDLKEKQVPDSKPRSLKSGKLPSIPSRTLARKDDLASSRPNARDASVSDHVAKGSISNDENESGEQNLAEYGSVSNVEEISGGSIVFSSQALPPENRKKAATRNAKSELPNQGKLAPASGKLAKNEANDKLNSEVAEPRRSNRRIQPTQG
ncbi:UNVERIFIED_CONTAM: protein AGENET DOMAIN (AGD)-CONTAINING P1 [Sesamum radiatum]|uniref:Protein AGENET DOMAIN (AGD)-CONTAINING P1 n=1 Tax=Sesamum radiatum TaxID=300843 RepID=A0AAW2MF99_SESRA